MELKIREYSDPILSGHPLFAVCSREYEGRGKCDDLLRLFEAAPDLLAALKQIAGSARDRKEWRYDGKDARGFVAIALEAIEKTQNAKGSAV